MVNDQLFHTKKTGRGLSLSKLHLSNNVDEILRFFVSLSIFRLVSNCYQYRIEFWFYAFHFHHRTEFYSRNNSYIFCSPFFLFIKITRLSSRWFWRRKNSSFFVNNSLIFFPRSFRILLVHPEHITKDSQTTIMELRYTPIFSYLYFFFHLTIWRR